MYKIVRDEMLACLPHYTDYGDQTLVYFKSGEKQVYKYNLRTFLVRLFDFYTIDRLAMKNKFYQMGIKELAPIVLDGRVYVGFKIRKPRLKYDGAHGYVRIDTIAYLKPKPVPIIVLNNEEEIPILDSFDTATNRYCLGLYVEKYLNGDL